MPRRIDQLTPEQTDRMASWADEWIERGRAVGEPDWQAWEAGARACYAAADVPWPGVVVRVPSPIVGAFASPIAAYLIAAHRQGKSGGAVYGAVRDAVYGAVGDAVGGAVRGAVYGAVGGAVRGAVRDAVGDAVDGAVRDAVGDAVRDAVRDAGPELKRAIERLWSAYRGGQWWLSWNAFSSFFRDVAQLELPDDLWARDRAYAAAQSAGWWWPFREFVMVSDRPRELHLEQVRERGWGSHRLHNPAGPSIRWSDGWALHHWHGTRVPADLIERGWDLQRIIAEPNTEIRRCAIERLGWDTFIEQTGLRAVHTAPDPGNPGAALALYDLDDQMQVFGEPVRLLLCRNGTPERDGTVRRFGLTVPASISDALAAAAWGYDDPAHPVRMTPELYAQIARRT